MSINFLFLAVAVQCILVPSLKRKTNSVKGSKWWKRQAVKIQWAKKCGCHSSTLTLLCTRWFFFTAHSGFSSPQSQSQVEWQESSAASVHFWILANSLLWWLESRVWKYYLQTPGFLKVGTQNGRNFIWHFEQTLGFSIFLMKPCISLCFKRKRTYQSTFKWYGWGDSEWCEYFCIANTIYYYYKSGMMAKHNGLLKSSVWDASAWIFLVSLVAYSLSGRHWKTYEHFPFLLLPLQSRK